MSCALMQQTILPNLTAYKGGEERKKSKKKKVCCLLVLSACQDCVCGVDKGVTKGAEKTAGNLKECMCVHVCACVEWIKRRRRAVQVRKKFIEMYQVHVWRE